MGLWLDRLGVLLLDATLAATLWVGVMVLVMVCCAQPARRCVLARVALLGALGIGPLVALRPGPRVDLPALVSWVSSPRWVSPGSGLALSPIVTRGLTLAYASGAGLALGWLALGWAGSCWITRRADAPDARILALYRRLPFPTSRPRPRLVVSSRITRPVLTGAVRPTLLLPRILEQSGTPEQLRLGLLHELAHARRRDPAFGLVAALAQAAWFFLPPLWWVRSQMRLDQEFLADHLAADVMGSHPSGYASSLVNLADPGVAAPAPTTQPARSRLDDPVSVSPLHLRVLMLVGCPFPVEPFAPDWWGLAILPTAVLALLGLSCLSLSELHPTRAIVPIQHGRFDLARLLIDAEPSPPQGFKPRRCTLPVRLPACYELRLDCRLGPGSPGVLEVAGVEFLLNMRTADPDTWHAIDLRRTSGGVTCQIDGRTSPFRHIAFSRNQLLEIKVPDGSDCQVRNLILTW